MGKRVLILTTFIFFTPLTIYLSVRLLLYSQKPTTPTISEYRGVTTEPLLTNFNPQVQSVSGEPLLADARPVIVKNYLERWNSPLSSYAQLIVSSSDFHGVNPLLVVAIAQQESNLGRKVIANCFNAWGWAQTSVYTRCFSSWEQGIKDYTKEFSQNYIKKGLTTPEEIMTRYNPNSPGGSWAKGVNQFLNELSGTSS